MMLFMVISYGQTTQYGENYPATFIVNSIDDSIPVDKVNIGTQKWAIAANQRKVWNGSNWLFDDAIIFRDGGFGYAYVDRANMGTIGDGGFDISTNWYRTVGEKAGATGSLSFSQGTDNVASGYASVAFGYNNTIISNYSFGAGVTNKTDPNKGATFMLGTTLDAAGGGQMTIVGQSNITPTAAGGNLFSFIVGNGTESTDAFGRVQRNVPSNAFVVRKNGRVEAPSLTPALIAGGGAKDLITREFISATVPTSATATGSKGQIAADANFLYICTATNTWKRVAIAAW